MATRLSACSQLPGAEPMTFAGLAGVGDLIATCMSPLSRNRRAGELMASGMSSTDAAAHLNGVAEGVDTVRGALELAGNLPSFDDLTVHPTINVDDLDPQCTLPGLVLNHPRKVAKMDTILNNSFGMLGINSTLIVKRFVA